MTPTFRFEYHDSRRGNDMVVFVHGLVGDAVTTWGRFPTLIATDPDLPDLDILLCGYRSRLVRWDPDISLTARRLISQLETEVESNARIFMVGHSMGGLVILSGLTAACRAGHARRRPTSNVAWVTLFASPVMGSQLAAGYKFLLNLLNLLPTRLITWFLSSGQVRQLATGPFVNELIEEVTTRLLCTEVESGDANAKRVTHVRVVVGDEDSVVEPTSAKGVFSRLPPKFVTGTHATIKEPADHRDSRYLALTSDIADALRADFSRLCAKCRTGDEQSQALFHALWHRALDERLVKASRREPVTEQFRRDMRALTWRIAADDPSITPGRAFDLALMRAVYRREERRRR